MNTQVRVLHPDQVWDTSRGCFMVGMAPSKERHRGSVVYVDDYGARFVIVPREGS